MNRLAHKVALVTGSSSGIGKAMALRFGEEGATVVVTARWMALCEQIVAQIKQKDGGSLGDSDRRDGCLSDPAETLGTSAAAPVPPGCHLIFGGLTSRMPPLD